MALIDLFAIEHGGIALEANDQHYGHIRNLNRPGRGVNMGDGWETRRRREPGFDWVIVKLGRPGTIREVLDRHGALQGQLSRSRVAQRGDGPGRIRRGARGDQHALAAAAARAASCAPTRSIVSRAELVSLGPVSHVRMNIHPDGGVSRLRLYGEAVRP